MSYPEGRYAAHWLKIVGEATDQPIFAHVNWFQRDADGRTLPVARLPGEPARPALAGAAEERRGQAAGETPVGIIPTREELNLDGLDIADGDLETHPDHRRRRAGARRSGTGRSTSSSSPDLPEEIWEAHRRVAPPPWTPD